MSTRALYTIVDADIKAAQAMQTRYGLRPAVKASKGAAWNLYIHHNGYPTGAADYVTKALAYAWELPRFEADEFAASLCAAGKHGTKGGNARFMPQGKPLAIASRYCSDIQYRYEIGQAVQGGPVTVKAYSVDIPWEGKRKRKPKEHLLFKCSIAEFVATATEWRHRRCMEGATSLALGE